MNTTSIARGGLEQYLPGLCFMDESVFYSGCEAPTDFLMWYTLLVSVLKIRGGTCSQSNFMHEGIKIIRQVPPSTTTFIDDLSNGKHNREQSTTRRVVKEFVHRIIFNVLPIHLFGTKFNAIQFEKNFRKIMFLGKYQVFSLNMVLHGIQVKRITFLRDIIDYNNKVNLFAKVFIWLVRVYILTALKSVFYVTVSDRDNKYVFYEKHVWNRIQHCRMKKMEKQVLRIHENCIGDEVQSKHLYTVKLIPKHSGYRPVFTKLRNNEYWKEKCRLTQKTVKVLLSRFAGDHFKNVHSSWRVLHEKWLSLLDKWKSNHQPMMYFVRTDFTDAFASVDLTKLMEIISKIREKNENESDIWFRYQGWLRSIPSNSAFKILEDYINKFFFEHNNKVYRLTKGLCQGGSLSSQLFDLYLGEWEKLYLTEYVEDENGFFIRNCDDCLYLTMNHAKAFSYFRLMQEGFPDFNLFINPRKTETNLRDESRVTVTFCNYTLNVQFFQIFKRCEFYRNCSVFHSSRFSSLESPGKIISNRVHFLCTLKLGEVFLDSAYNTVNTTLYNVFMVASVSIATCLVYMERVFTHFNSGFIRTSLVGCSRRIAKVAHGYLQSNDNVNTKMLQWIVMKAFLVQMELSISKNWANVMLEVDRFLKNLFVEMNVTQQEIILEFILFHRPESFKSLM